MSLTSTPVAKDLILKKVFNVCAWHSILYPEEGRVRFCLLLEYQMAGKVSVMIGGGEPSHSCSRVGGKGGRGCWLTLSTGKAICTICICTLDTTSECMGCVS